MGQSHLGNLFHPMRLQSWARLARDSWSTEGPRTRTRVAWEIWSTLRALGHLPESPGSGDRPHDPLTRARDARDRWLTPGALGHMCESPGKAVQHPGTRARFELPGTAGQPRGPSEPGLSHPGQLVDPASPREWARVPRECWSTPKFLGTRLEFPGQLVKPVGPQKPAQFTRKSWWTPRAIVPGPELPGSAGRPCGPSVPGLRLPGQLFDPAGPQARE